MSDIKISNLWEKALVVTFENGTKKKITLNKLPKGLYNVLILSKDSPEPSSMTSIDYKTLYKKLYLSKFGREGNPTDEFIVSLVKD